MAATEESSEQLQYKTCSLKVSIHCEGCKRKVKKVLQNVEGVYSTAIDSQLNKVTIIGNVDPETLIKKLVKTGKPAEIWPEKIEKKEKKSGKGGGKDGEKDVAGKNGDKKSPENSGEKQPSAKNSGAKQPGPENSESAATNSGVGDGQSKEPKSDDKAPENLPAGDVSPSESDNKSTETGGGSGGKKKGKKKQKDTNNEISSNNSGDSETPGATNPDAAGSKAESGSAPLPATPSFHHGPPHQAVYSPYPPPIYAVNYNTAYPRASYGASFYPAPAHPSTSYGESYYHIPAHPSTSYTESYYSAQQPPPYTYPGSYPPPPPPTNSYDMFSDENPNGCRVM